MRELALELYEAAVVAAAPGELTARAVDGLVHRAARVVSVCLHSAKPHSPRQRPVTCITFAGLHAIIGGVVVSPDGGPTPYPTIVSMRGDYPIPGRNSFAAAAKIAEGGCLQVVAGTMWRHHSSCLHGASSLIAGGIRGLSDPDVTSLYELLANSGLDIASLNAKMRIAASHVRGAGHRFARTGSSRRRASFAISDVATTTSASSARDRARQMKRR